MAIWMEAAQQRKGRSVDAIKKSSGHPLVINSAARLFWSERKVEKARVWLQRAVDADKDNGDLWAWWLKFERQHGEQVRHIAFQNQSALTNRSPYHPQERQEAVIKQCVAQEPKHGILWSSIAKDVKNAGKSTAEILELVAATIR